MRNRPAEVGVRRVLLLNVTYEPLTTVGLRRAVCLVLSGKAEMVHDNTAGASLHSASGPLAPPRRAPPVPEPGPADPRGLDAAGHLPVRVLRSEGRPHRPCDPAQPRRP